MSMLGAYSVLCIAQLLSRVRGEAIPQEKFAPKENNEIPAQVALKPVFLGIDLGTTYSAAYFHDPEYNQTQPLTFGPDNELVLPSTLYVADVDSEGRPIIKVGYDANLLNVNNPAPLSYYYGHKRLVGVPDFRKDPRTARFGENVTYEVNHRADSAGKPYHTISIYHHAKKVGEMTPTELSALILGHIMRNLENRGFTPTNIVITTPAYFTFHQDNEVRSAAKSAGFKKVNIAKEPIAACATYVKESNMALDVEEKVLVFDFGGGTLDISVVEVVKEIDEEDSTKKAVSKLLSNTSSDGTSISLNVEKLTGSNFLGGENVNKMLVDHFLRRIGSEKAPKKNDSDRLRLHLFAEKFKIDLCKKQLAAGEERIVHSDTFTLSDGTSFELSMSSDLFDSVVKPVYDDVHDLFTNPQTGLFRKKIPGEAENPADPDTISKIILVGGSTRIPYIRKYLKNLCKKATLYYDIDADMAVARGACLLCMADQGDSSIVLTNAVPLPIGIAVSNGLFQPIIQKDASIPTFAVMPFTTVRDNQTEVLIEVAQGVRPLFKDNEPIGQFVLKLSKPAPAQVPKINVHISYHDDYKITVTATEESTGESVAKEFRPAFGRPDQSKIDEILAAAKANEAADAEIKKKFETIQSLEATIKMFEEQITASPNLSEDDKIYYETVTKNYKDWIEQYRTTATASLVEAKLDALRKELEEFIQKTRVTAGGGAPAASEAAAEKEAVREEL